ncbi:RidA family protein [Parvularcula maris]|uniref:RidA family protein n=1 Tax=Parvularcula maris TaxID=2965077 RepID=A0A9X2L9G5_9PROT|nr:RidA family protein [Parvularcula maris]
MTTVEEKLAEKGYTLPEPAAPLASYVPFVKSRNLLFISGQLPMQNGEIMTGHVGTDLSVEEGAKAAELCAVNIIAQIGAALTRDFGRLRDVVKLEGFVSCGPDFTQHPEVINGASELFAHVFCSRGSHCRTAVGVPSLPRGAAVEIAAVISID